jgi:hypothetical protein
MKTKKVKVKRAQHRMLMELVHNLEEETPETEGLGYQGVAAHLLDPPGGRPVHLRRQTRTRPAVAPAAGDPAMTFSDFSKRMEQDGGDEALLAAFCGGFLVGRGKFGATDEEMDLGWEAFTNKEPIDLTPKKSIREDVHLEVVEFMRTLTPEESAEFCRKMTKFEKQTVSGAWSAFSAALAKARNSKKAYKPIMVILQHVNNRRKPPYPPTAYHVIANVDPSASGNEIEWHLCEIADAYTRLLDEERRPERRIKISAANIAE